MQLLNHVLLKTIQSVRNVANATSRSQCLLRWLVGFHRLVDANDSCIYAEIRTRILDIIPQDYVIDDDGGIPISFAVKVPYYSSHADAKLFFATEQSKKLT